MQKSPSHHFDAARAFVAKGRRDSDQLVADMSLQMEPATAAIQVADDGDEAGAREDERLATETMLVSLMNPSTVGNFREPRE